MMPPVRFLPIASGSKGNCYYVETAHTRLLIDCGISYRRLSATLLENGISPASLDSVAVTHTHSDHISGLAGLLGRHQLRVYVHERAVLPLDLELRRQGHPGGLDTHDVLTFSSDGFPHRDIDMLPVPVSHDCHPTVMFKMYAPKRLKLGVLTDLGVFDSQHATLFGDCDLLVLESNHCPEMLRQGPYPAQLKARIAGSRGHLSNTQALEFVLGLPRLPQELILGHLSDTNNTPCAASTTFQSASSATSLPALAARGPLDQLLAGQSTARPGFESACGTTADLAPASFEVTAALTGPEQIAGSGGIPHRVLVQMTPGTMLELSPR